MQVRVCPKAPRKLWAVQVWTMSNRHPVGEVLDSLDVTVALDDGDLVSDAVVLVKVIEADGAVKMATVWSSGLGWIERLGMLTAAQQSESLPPDLASIRDVDGEDDE